MCIYGMEGPGGYQLFGRTIQMWNTWRTTSVFEPGHPWLLRFFDQIRFFPVTGEALLDAHLDEAIAGLRCRCLVLAGAHDGLRPPEDVAALARRLPGAEFAVLDTAHVMPVQAPELFAEHVLEFFLR